MPEKPVTISVRGKDRDGDDAPLVADVLAQIRDFTELLHKVAIQVAGDGKSPFKWKLKDARKNSPITFDLEPFVPSNTPPPLLVINDAVVATSNGINELQLDPAVPEYFDDECIALVSRIYERVTKGLDQTYFDATKFGAEHSINISKETALHALANIEASKKSPPPVYKELSSVEGKISSIELDAYNRPMMQLRSRIDGTYVKCAFKDGLDRIGHYEVGEVLEGLRVRAFGVIHYIGLGRITHMDVEEVTILGDLETLPTMDEIVSPNFTDSQLSEDYLEQGREHV